MNASLTKRPAAAGRRSKAERRASSGQPSPFRADFAERLLAWFDRKQRDLPWRRGRTPYRVLVAEVMLQQTTVAAAVPYFERFVARFEDWSALAAASESDVLAAWSGLGYYRRARSLHQTARAVAQLPGRELPTDRDALLALPGIGPYTAGAVLSLAYGLPAAAVDGNVARVMSRLAGRTLDSARGVDRRELDSIVLAAQPVERPGAFNEALMELGATTCTPRVPDCPRCPVRAGCRARIDARTGEIPAARARPAPVQRTAAAVLVRSGERVLLRRRAGTESLMPGLWELPGGFVMSGTPEDFVVSDVLPGLGGGRVVGLALRLAHVITNRRITLHVLECELRGRTPRRADLRLASRQQAAELPLTGVTTRALERLPTRRTRPRDTGP